MTVEYAIDLLMNEETFTYRLACGTDVEAVEGYVSDAAVYLYNSESETGFDLVLTERYGTREEFDRRLEAVMKAYPGSQDAVVHFWL